MNLHATPSRPVREISHLAIPLSDGCRLAARVWLPEDAGTRPVPAVLEYIPYRKRDHTAPRDETWLPKMAARGYAVIRLDLRGNGESEGLMADEYLPRELEDGAEAIAWIAGQPWCSGDVGMIGISWGGFNGLQIAALRPPALKAVVTVCSTDDRYADDIHYRGGCLLNDNLAWAGAMMAFSSRPPDPALAGARWREMWMERLDNMPFLAANWLIHQRRDAFWRHGSVCEDPAAIDVPVLAVGGWADPYSNAVPRMVSTLSAPCHGLIGPWGHKYPHAGIPGPAMDFVAETVAWWDRWLGGQGANNPPRLRAYMLDGPDDGGGPDERRGVWIAEDRWPSPNVDTETLHLSADGGLRAEAGDAAGLELCSPPATGLAGGRFYPKLGRPDMAGDQRPDDGASLVFDGPVLDTPLDILGAPLAELVVAADRPRANIAVRLCHVAPGGASHRVTLGVLNLCHRAGHAAPAPLEPGRRYRVAVRLDDIGYRVPAGHRLRLAVSTAYWPMLWPSAEAATLTVDTGDSRLHLPVRRADAGGVIDIPAIEPADPVGIAFLREPASERRLTRDHMTGEIVFEALDDSGLKRSNAHGLEFGLSGRETYGIRDDNPLSAWARTHWTTETGRGDWRVRTEATSAMHADATTFHLEAELTAFENGHEVFRERWRRAIPRDHV